MHVFYQTFLSSCNSSNFFMIFVPLCVSISVCVTAVLSGSTHNLSMFIQKLVFRYILFTHGCVPDVFHKLALSTTDGDSSEHNSTQASTTKLWRKEISKKDVMTWFPVLWSLLSKIRSWWINPAFNWEHKCSPQALTRLSFWRSQNQTWMFYI